MAIKPIWLRLGTGVFCAALSVLVSCHKKESPGEKRFYYCYHKFCKVHIGLYLFQILDERNLKGYEKYIKDMSDCEYIMSHRVGKTLEFNVGGYVEPDRLVEVEGIYNDSLVYVSQRSRDWEKKGRYSVS